MGGSIDNIGNSKRFKAACVSAGIADWISDISTEDVSTAMEALFGEPYWDNYELWRKASPISYVNNMTTPTLILHGEDDKRVPITQAQQLHQALKMKRVPTRFVSYIGQEHHFDDPLATVDAMKEKIAWFKTYSNKEKSVIVR